MLLHVTTTYSIGALTLFFSMSKFMAFEAAHWNRDMRSPWYCKVPSSQACRRLWTIKSQDDSIDRNLNVSLTHMTAPGVGDVIEFLHEFFLSTVMEIARLVDTFGSANAIVRPNSVFSCSLSRSSAMRSTLRCLVPPWSSAPRILTNSLLVLKGGSMNVTLLVSSAEVRYHLFLCLSLCVSLYLKFVLDQLSW